MSGWRGRGRLSVTASLVAWVFTPGLHAQVASTVGAGIEFQSFSFSEADDVGVESLSLVTLPVAVSVPLAEWISLGMVGHWARTEKTRPDGETLTLSGFTDTELSATVRVPGDVASFTAVVALPTGNSTHDADEVEVAGNVASDLLPFRISNWGSGGGGGARASVAKSFGTVAAGVSVGYFVARDFTPLTFADTEYRAGNNLVIRAALDGNVGPAGKLSLQLTLRSYGNDQQDGVGGFQSGNRYQAIGSYAFAVGPRSSGVVYLGALRRSEGELEGVPLRRAQTLYMAGGGASFRLGQILMRPSVDARVLRSETGVDQGYNTGFGVRAEVGVGRAVLVPLVRIHIGKLALVKGVSESSFVGTDLGLTVRFGGR